MATVLSKVLIAGATGNVGMSVLKALKKTTQLLDIFAGVNDLDGDSKKLAAYKVSFEKFDFTNAVESMLITDVIECIGKPFKCIMK